MREHFYFTAQLGPNRHETPEGYLVCMGVAIARTGIQEYGPGETPVEPGPDGVVYIDRVDSEVFRPETIASANGKSLCNDHPEDDVSPKTWRELTVGICLNPRRGEGDDANAIIADLMWTDHKAIGLVTGGKVELSCGYDCDYEQDEPGKGRQLNITINHIALVDLGRCGSQCSVKDSRGDHSMCRRVTDADWVNGHYDFDSKREAEEFARLQGSRRTEVVAKSSGGWEVRVGDKKASGGSDMARRFNKVKDSLRKAFDSKDEKELEKALDLTRTALDEEREEGMEEGEKKAKWTDDALDDRFDSIDAKQKEHDGKIATHDSDIAELKKDDDESAEEEESTGDAMEEEAPEGKEKEARKAKDSALLQESFQDTVSMAEIIAPGLHIQTFDAARSPRKTLDAICGLRRKALQVAGSTTDGAALISSLRGGKVLTADKALALDCKDVRTLFLGVGAAMRKSRTATGDHKLVDPNKPATTKVEDSADINTRNRNFWN